ncbi:UNVERIFIED_CONTAM: Dynein light chain, cytoplasmic [Sesamum calycinum]|uniref:Dynein light chain n=1 Tax=Sesamum calycinum TaxID=2727403 RepID=A0AAW2S9V6_9LAMI
MSDDSTITSAVQFRGKKVDVKIVEMKRGMVDEAINIAVDALSKFSAHQDVAEYMKKMFDKIYGAPWHCIIGHYFVFVLFILFLDACLGLRLQQPRLVYPSVYIHCSYVSHEKDGFIYFYVDHTAVLLYKSGVIVRRDMDVKGVKGQR